MPEEFTVTIAGKTSTLKFPWTCRKEIEKRLDKGLWDACFSGLVDDIMVILWAGLKHDTKAHKGLTVDILEKQIESHVEQTGKYPSDIFNAAIRAALNSNMLELNKEQVNLVMDKFMKDGEEGKA